MIYAIIGAVILALAFTALFIFNNINRWRFYKSMFPKTRRCRNELWNREVIQ